MNSLENDLKIDIINQRQGENLADINFIQGQIETTNEQELIDEYNNNINDLMAKNLALESLKQTLL
jgi:hypothetical protein